MPRRYLSPSVARDKLFNRIAQKSEFAALVYLMGLPHAADDCALPTNDAEELQLVVCPARRDKGPREMEEAVRMLTTEADEDGHRLLEYGPDGRLRYPPGSFYRHQTYVPEGKRAAARVEELGEGAGGQGRKDVAEVSEKRRDEQETRAFSETRRDQKRVAEVGASFTFTPSVSPSVPNASPPPAAGAKVRTPTRLGELTVGLAERLNGARGRLGNGNVQPSGENSGGVLPEDDALWRRHPAIAHYVLEAEEKLGDRHSRAFLVQLANGLYGRGALECVWPRALGLAREQAGARNRGAVFVSIVRRLAEEQGIEMRSRASPGTVPKGVEMYGHGPAPPTAVRAAGSAVA